MRNRSLSLLGAASVMALTGSLSLLAPTHAQELGAAPSEGDAVEKGREIAFDRRKGNCLACHMIQGGTLPGNIGPPLIAMKARFPDKDKLRAQIADPTESNPHSVMPRFETYGVLTSEEVDLVTDYVYTL